MSLVKNLSVSVEVVYPNETRIYLCQTGHTTLLPWVLEGFQSHLKDSDGQSSCVFAMALAMNQWTGAHGMVEIRSEPMPSRDLCLSFDFRDGRVLGVFKKNNFEMEMIEWMGTPIADLPFGRDK